MADLSLSAVSPADAIAGWTVGSTRAEYLLKLCFRTGNKVSAHFTTENAVTQNATIADLCEALQLVIDLVNREAFDASNWPKVVFTIKGNHGYIAKIL
jgi:hypothetical protein